MYKDHQTGFLENGLEGERLKTRGSLQQYKLEMQSLYKDNGAKDKLGKLKEVLECSDHSAGPGDWVTMELR